MDLKIGLSILLLLAHTSLSSSKPDNPSSSSSLSWRRYYNRRSHLVNHQPLLRRRSSSSSSSHRHHYAASAVPRRVRALSEYLLPPPAPVGPNFRPLGVASSSSSLSLKPASSQLLPVVHSRQGRVVQQQPPKQQQHQQQQESKPINYLSRLMNLLNPFAKDDDDDDDDDDVVDIAASHPGPDYPRLPLPPPQIVAQYAPQMPYIKREHTFTTPSYYPAPAAPPIPALLPTPSIANNYHPDGSGNDPTTPWAGPAATSGKSCNACNKVPWVPIVHNNLYSNPTGQYAPNAGHVVTSGYVASSSYQVQTQHDQHHQSLSPPLKLSASSFKSNSPGLLSTEYGPPSSGQIASQDYKTLPQFTNGDGHGSSQNSYNHGPPSLDINNNNNNNNNFNHQSSGVSISDHHQSPPSSNFGSSGESFDGIELDHPPPDYHNQDSSNLDYEQHHQSSDLIGVVKEPGPSDSNNDQLHGQEPEHAESRPVITNNNNNDNNLEHHNVYYVSSTTSPPPIVHVNKNTLTVHFQRSPIIDLSVAGISPVTSTPSTTTTTTSSSSTRRPIYQRSPPTFEGKSNNSNNKNNNNNNIIEATKPRLEASLIDYIVSGPRESFVSGERKTVTGSSVIIPIGRTTTTTSTRRPITTADIPSSTTTTSSTRSYSSTIGDQKQQGSIIETLVQSYNSNEQQRSRERNADNNGQRERELLTRPYKDVEDYSSSASREVVVPHKDSGKNNKQIIQIIIPYTSQYTPSPFHPTHAINGHAKNFVSPIESQSSSSSSSEEIGIEEIDDDDNDNNNSSSGSNSGVEDNVLIEESRRVSVTHGAATSDNKPAKRNRPTPRASSTTTSTSTTTTTTTTTTTSTTEQPPAFLSNNAIDVHRLQKNIDNWTIQEYAKSTKLYSKHTNLTYPRWLSSKQIPDEYLVSAQAEQLEDSNEYYDYSNETELLLLHRWSNRSEINPTPESSTEVNIINATYPRKPKTQEYPPMKHPNDSKSHDSERVYVVTPVPNPNSLETDLSAEGKQHQQQKKGNYERAYQVLPQAVNNLAVLVNAPESAAPALWGIMEHEDIPTSPNQPRWRSESDVAASEPISTPILYGGHSKVSRAR